MLPSFCTNLAPTLSSPANAGAMARCGEVLQADAGDSEAANNRALCAMFGGNLMAAVQALEAAFAAAPDRLMQVGWEAW